MDQQPSSVSAPPRRLLRSPDDRMVAGVCGGLAEYTGIDPIVFRIVFAVAIVSGGGILAYVLAWIFIPERPSDGSVPPRRTIRGIDAIVAIVVGVIALQILFRVVFGRGMFDGDGGLLLLLGVAAGIWWWSRQEHLDDAADPTPAWLAPDDGSDSSLFPPEPAPPPPSPRSRLPLVGVSVLLVLWGILLLADAAGVTVDGQVAIGVSLAVLGAVVLLGAWFGRPRGLIAVGIVLAAAGILASAVDAPFGGGFGERSWVVRDAAALRGSYRLTAGEAVLDLSDLDLRRDRDVAVSVWAGELLVVLPADADVQVDGRVGLGELTFLGDHEDGFGLGGEAGDDDEGPTLRIEVRMGVGELEVRRAAA